MLNVFPIQFLALLAYFILRVFVGITLLYLGFTHFKHRHTLKEALTLSWWPYGSFSTALLFLSELILGSMFILGAYTQIAALFIVLLSLKLIVLRGRFNHPTIPSRLTYTLFLGAALSLFITGAGAFAFDLPL